MSRGRAKRPRPTWDSLAATAHQMRSSLNGIHTWAHLLEVRVGPSAEPSIRRALDGIHAGVRSQVSLIENLLEGRAVEPALRKLAMSKRNDAQPEVPEETPQRDKPRRPRTEPKEAPGGKDASKARADARNKSARTGQR